MTKYTFWFCSNRFYNSAGVCRATWWSKPFLLMGLDHQATVRVHGAANVEEARLCAVKSFREIGLKQQIMGQEY